MELIKLTASLVANILWDAIVFAVPLMLLWNWIVPEVFGFHALNFWQSLGLMLICDILFRTQQQTDDRKSGNEI